MKDKLLEMCCRRDGIGIKVASDKNLMMMMMMVEFNCRFVREQITCRVVRPGNVVVFYKDLFILLNVSMVCLVISLLFINKAIVF